MATLMIRSMDERVKAELRVLAARRGVSMERHARDILERAVLGPAHDEPFAQRVQRQFAGVAVDGLPLPQRQLPRSLPGRRRPPEKAAAKPSAKVAASGKR